MVMPDKRTTRREKQSLCLQCGMCCNGVIFSNLRLTPEDDAARLSRLLPLKRMRARGRAEGDARFQFLQPCAALVEGRCTIYGDRPGYCREFECLLLQRVTSGTMGTDDALKKLKRMLRLVRQAGRLLELLRDGNRKQPLAARYRRVMVRAEREGWGAVEAAAAGKLSLLMHKLSLALSKDFYPGP